MEIHCAAFDTAENVTLPACRDCVTSSFVMTKSFHPSPIISQRQPVVSFVIFFFFFFSRSTQRTLTLSPAGVREAEGLQADPGVQHGEGQS